MPKSLSVLYLVRNEQDYIYKSIKSINEIADEIIIIDTGSIDRTVEICKTFTSKIFKYKWNDNFSEARNFGLSKCTKDYVLYINADEVISEEDIGKVRNILEKQSLGAYNFSIQDCLGKWEKDILKLKSNYSQSPQIRLFPRDENIKFEGNVFETIDDSLNKIPSYSIFNSGITILHHAFRGDPAKNKEISERYYSSIASSEKQLDVVRKMGSYQMKIEQEFINKKCAIVIACHKIPTITKRCIESIRRNTSYPYKIIIVDNGSDERTLEYLHSLTDVDLIEKSSNTGVSIARNEGMKLALKMDDVSYVCLLDNDTEVYAGWLKNMVSVLSENSVYGMIGPFTTSAIGSQSVVKNSWVGRYSSEEIISMVKSKGTASVMEVGFLDRFCQVFRKESLESIGFLEEGFGLIGREDQDYCKRFVNSGYKLCFSKESFVFHKGHATCTFNKMPYFKLIQEATRLYNEKWNLVKTNRVGSDYGERCEENNVVSSPFTSIVVLTYNNLDINKRFVNAIEKFTHNYELICVDNGSTDGTIEFLESLGNRITLIKNGENLGIPVGRNIGLKAAKYDYLICLDNDQIVKDKWLENLHLEMRKGFDFVGVEAWQVNSSNLPIKRHMGRIPGMRIDYVGAGGCLMKRSVLENIGIYDERFSPAYFEDVELCFRAKENGYMIGWCDKNIILHLEHSTLIKGQKEFNYNSVMEESHKKLIEKLEAKKRCTVFEEIKLPKRSKVTFCMALKGRSERALNSIKSIINQRGSDDIHFIIIEDHSDDMLYFSGLDNSDKITHLVVESGFSWNKSLLINQIIPIIRSEYICFWDADFIYPNNFLIEYFNLLDNTDFNKQYLQIMVTETRDSNKKGEIIEKGTLWGGFYTYKTEHFLGINGFDENFVGWGYEDIDFNVRIVNAYGLVSKVIQVQDLVFHDSHDDTIRHMKHKDTNKELFNKNIRIKASRAKSPTILKQKWRSEKMKVDASETIAVICNGPSLRDINLNSLKEKNIDCFTMNMSFRQWYKTGFWSRYWGCFDYVVTDNHREEFKKFIEDPNVPIERFFLLRKVSDSPRLTTISFKSRELHRVGTSLEDFGDVGNTGCNCCQVALALGYKKIILLGADCNYVDIVDGAKQVGNKLVMEKTPEKNPNYAWDDYNQKGDEYNVPRADVFQMPGWKALASHCSDNGIQVVNCSMQSKIEYFRKNTLEKELTLY